MYDFPEKLGVVGVFNGTGKLQCERRGRRLNDPFVGAGFHARP